MPWRIDNSSPLWSEGVFCVPLAVAQRLMNFADENKIKTLLLICSNSGLVDVKDIASKLKISESEAEENILFWANEGLLTDGKEQGAEQKDEEKEEKRRLDALPVPSYTPKDIVRVCSEQPEIADLLRASEEVLASSLSNAMKSNIINMVTYYGLPAPVIITLLQYYKSERDKGKSITTRTLQNMARDWANDEVYTLDAASEKLQELKSCDELWSNVLSLCEIDYRKPTSAQRKMINRWMNDFSNEMIAFACNTMKKYTKEEDKSLKAVDNILKEWKRKGFKTPDDVKAQPKKDKKGKKGKEKLHAKPSFDIDEIAKKAKFNDDYDI